MESESEWNRTNIFRGGIGIGIELGIVDPESELNWNRLLPELHITGFYTMELTYRKCRKFIIRMLSIIPMRNTSFLSDMLLVAFLRLV